MVFLWYFHEIPVGFLVDLRKAFMGFNWDLDDIAGRFLWDFCVISMIFLVDSYDI